MFETIKSYGNTISQFVHSGSKKITGSALNYFYSTENSQKHNNEESTNNDNQQQLQVTNNSNSRTNYYFQQVTSILPNQVTSLLSETLKFGSSFKVNGQLVSFVNSSFNHLYNANSYLTNSPTQIENSQINVNTTNSRPEVTTSIVKQNFLNHIHENKLTIPLKKLASESTLIKVKGKSQKKQLNLEKAYDDANIPLKNNFWVAQAEQMTGYTPEILEKIHTVIDTLGFVYGIRPLNPLAAKQLGKKKAAKPMDIKAKSALNGPCAGMIPFDQSFSKVAENGEQAISNYNKLNNKVIETGQATIVPCEITFNWLIQLISEKKLMQINIKNFCVENKLDFKTFKIDDLLIKWENSNRIYFAVLRMNEKLNYQAYLLDRETKKISETPLLVMGSKDQKIIVADIDSCFYMAKRKSFDPNGKDAIKPFRHSKGITNDRHETYRQIINENIGYEAIMHGPDVFNPNTVPKDNYPMTIFIPQKIVLRLKDVKIGNQEIRKVFIANDIEQLDKLVRILQEMDYRGYFNYKWFTNEENKPLRRSIDL